MTTRIITTVAMVAGLTAWPAGEAGAAVQERPEDATCDCRDRGFNMNWLGDGAGAFSVIGFPRARIGVSLGAEDQRAYDDRGALVREVQEGGPADAAGLRAGDVITAVDGHSLLDPLSGSRERGLDEDQSLPVQRLLALARSWDPGDEIEITYERDGSAATVTIEAEEADFEFGMGNLRGRMGDLGQRLQELAPRMRERGERAGTFLRESGPRISFWGPEGEGGDFFYGFGRSGLRLAEINPDLGRYFDTDTGVLVLEVDDGDNLALEAGDVILSIDGRSVDSPSDVYRILGSYEDGESMTVTVIRDGDRVEVVGTGR